MCITNIHVKIVKMISYCMHTWRINLFTDTTANHLYDVHTLTRIPCLVMMDSLCFICFLSSRHLYFRGKWKLLLTPQQLLIGSESIFLWVPPYFIELLTHLPLVPHICVIESGQAIIWTKRGLLLIGPLGRNKLHWNFNQNTKCSFKNVHLKIPFA